MATAPGAPARLSVKAREKLPFIVIVRGACLRSKSVPVKTARTAGTVHRANAPKVTDLLSVATVQVEGQGAAAPHSVRTDLVEAARLSVVRDKVIGLFVQDPRVTVPPSVKVRKTVDSVPGLPVIGQGALAPHSVRTDLVEAARLSVVRVKGIGPVEVVRHFVTIVPGAGRRSVATDLVAVALRSAMTVPEDVRPSVVRVKGEDPRSKNEPVGNFLRMAKAQGANAPRVTVQGAVAPHSATTVQGVFDPVEGQAAVVLHSVMTVQVADQVAIVPLSVATDLGEAVLHSDKTVLRAIGPRSGKVHRIVVSAPGLPEIDQAVVAPRSAMTDPVEVARHSVTTAPVEAVLHSVTIVHPGIARRVTAPPSATTVLRATGPKVIDLLSVKTDLWEIVPRVRPGNAMPLGLTISVPGAIAPRSNRQLRFRGKPLVRACRPKRLLTRFRPLVWRR
jgi:hypothetical protein